MAAKNLRQFEFKLGKLGVVLFIIGLSVLIFAGFLLGVQVGRNIDTYPELISRGIPAKMLNSIGLSSPLIKPEIPVGTSGVHQTDTSTEDGKAGKRAEGEKAAAVMMTPPAAQEAAVENKEAAVDPAGKSLTTSPAASPASEVASQAAPRQVASMEVNRAVNPPQTPVETKKVKPPAEAKKEAMPPNKNGRFTVQVVSFREKEKADALSKKIKDLGYTPKVSMTEVPGKGQWYRVTVNGFETKQAAEKAADSLIKKIKGVSCVVKSR
jgi:cell division protein FtsN